MASATKQKNSIDELPKTSHRKIADNSLSDDAPETLEDKGIYRDVVLGVTVTTHQQDGEPQSVTRSRHFDALSTVTVYGMHDRELEAAYTHVDEQFDGTISALFKIMEQSDAIQAEQSRRRHALHDRTLARFQALQSGKMGVDRLPLTDEERDGLAILNHLVGDAQLDLSQGQVNSLRAFVGLLGKTF